MSGPVSLGSVSLGSVSLGSLSYARRRAAGGVLVLALVLALGGCASSEAPSTPPDSEGAESEAPVFTGLHVTESGALAVQTGSERDVLQDEVRATGLRAAAPGGDRVAFSYRTADSTVLAVAEVAEASAADAVPYRVERVDGQPGQVTYTATWHPGGNGLAYTYASADGAGPGEVFFAQGTGRTQAGCGAARAVLAWLPEGRLVTRDEENLYVVEADGCATRSRVDARRMHHIRIAPGGARMAFIHRELVYDRSQGAYVPDSSLVLSRLDGTERQELFGNERSVRHLRWSPGGTELAFDAVLEGATRRQVVVYNLDRDETVYLVPPPAAPDADQVHPRWSPSGSHVAFTLRSPGASDAAVQIKGQLRRLAPTDGPVWGWVDDRSLVAPGPDSLRVVDLNGRATWTAPRPGMLLHVGRSVRAAQP